MARKTQAPLPEALLYLQPFARSLERLAPDELNEDVDPTRLAGALRKRLRGLDDARAEAELEDDRAILAAWLETEAPPDHPANWLLDYGLSTGLAFQIARPREPAPAGPEMTFEIPKDWKLKASPFQLQFKKGKLIGQITAIDDLGFEISKRQREHEIKPPIGVEFPFKVPQILLEKSDVTFRPVIGRKYVQTAVTPKSWKRVEYILSVPGGYMSVILDGGGRDFDESLVESKLHTLKLAEPESTETK
jgi:hypothetical protein